MTRTLLTANLDVTSSDPVSVWKMAQQTLDLGGQYTVTVHLPASNSAANWLLEGELLGQRAPGNFVIDGGSIYTIISAPPNLAAVQAQGGAKLQLQNMTLEPSSGGSGVTIVTDGVVYFGNMQFVAGGQCFVHTAGPRAYACAFASNYLTMGNGTTVNTGFLAEDNSLITLGAAFQTAGVPTWTNAFVQGDWGGMIDATGFTFSGIAQGPRYRASALGKVFTGGSGGLDFFPGNSPGDATGGFYQ